jgi:hypothetical protein
MSNEGKARTVHRCECRVCQVGEDQEVVAYHAHLNQFLSCLSEPQRRWYVGLLSQEPLGLSDHELARITGLARQTIRRGRQELSAGVPLSPTGRQRQPGGGQPKAEKKTPT